MDIRKVKKLIEMLENSSLNEIVIKEGEESVKLVKSAGNIQTPQMIAASPQVLAPAIEEKEPEEKTKEEPEDKIISGKSINSPMVGTFYSSPNPGADSFVKVGDKVSEGDVLCIIEAMKMMNEVKSDYSGIIKEILISDADPVEYGEALFIIEE
ncbi:acetyl-CoA carboxylase biotin carboxyl carrier protein [Gammaproteobacteria bacterium]|jgi:acetyl-CoA carboxylase biotin carboxyl carrier protein|nr:acetyl-CoA carboxylase biotin carboxyl carrier protein [SAR86 cluster bacterium]MDC1138970.1 acetyl-CoA carboxylase biotin carboxyl carrier protein [Gammaproteobacteria bacterium]RZP01239.1 MAG: acetyl-CoA carboxylase biotin carboxyl carrier protein [Gammaproteobacteria bacterium]|tara:strand:+ start:789 stop:1250 length:462 start_codon:yes stop_codon:yes gene_type:complete